MRNLKIAPILLLFIILSLCGCSSRKTIVNGLDLREANEIMVFLSNNGVNAYKVRSKEGQNSGGGLTVVLWDIAVDASQAQESLSLLNSNGLPRRKGQNLLDLFSSSSLVPSSMQEKVRYQAGLGQQIASTIRNIDGVIEAEVNLTFPEEDSLNPKVQKDEATAAVYVKHTGVLDDPNSHLHMKVKRLVSSAVNGLKFENVTVVSDRARFCERHSDSMNKKSEEQDLVRVWSVAIAKQSLTRFQMIFLAFSILSFLLVLTLAFLIWKMYPLIQNHGGYKTLFSLHGFAVENGPNLIVKNQSENTIVMQEGKKESRMQENIET